jgi:hypothetical protein
LCTHRPLSPPIDTEVAVARQSSGPGRTRQSPAKSAAARAAQAKTAPPAPPEPETEPTEPEDVEQVTTDGGSADVSALWAEVRIDPVEIALPHGVGYTLRAYRPSTELAEPDLGDREDDLFEAEDEDSDEPPPIDEEELTRLALASGRRRDTRDNVAEDEDEEEDAEDDEEDVYDEDAEAEAGADEDAEAEDEAGDEAEGKDEDEDEDEAGDEEDTEDAAVVAEDVPVFLSHRGRLLVFRSAESLVDFVRSDAEHELTQLDSWTDLRSRISTEDVVPQPEDTYELDLVVKNLRGGVDAWDSGLLIQAGEVARDLGYALRKQSILGPLSPGSPLDDLDEALRTAEAGGFRSFLARRRLRKIGAETAALSWRTIIGEISTLADWRD